MDQGGRAGVPLEDGIVQGISLSMAAVLPLPQGTPYRDRLIAIVFGVTLVSLLTQALPFRRFLTWLGVGAFVEYPKTWEGLMACYTLALPFYKTSLIATVVFSAVLFGSWYLIVKRQQKEAIA